MDIWGQQQLVLFVIFVIPGFVALKLYELLYPAEPRDSSKQLVDAIAYSCVNYALLFWPIVLVERSGLRVSHPGLYALFYMVALFIGPVAWTLAWKGLRETNLLRAVLPHPTAKPWHYVFAQGKVFWIVVTLKNGERIGGMYGFESFTSSAPAAEQLYLEQEWIVNDEGGLDRPVNQTAGVMVLGTDIETVQFYKSGEADSAQEDN